MTIISQERREAILKKIISPDINIAGLAREEGISSSTLYTWKQRYLCSMDKGMTGNYNNSSKLASESKFLAVVETASLSESECNDYCRAKGIYPEQLKEWKKSCMQANSPLNTPTASNKEIKQYKNQIRSLEKELKYKEKALSETAALLVLRKKLSALWGGGSEEGSHL